MALDVSVPASVMESELNALPNIGPNGVTVSRTAVVAGQGELGYVQHDMCVTLDRCYG